MKGLEGLKVKEFLAREGDRLGIRKQEELAARLGVSDQAVSNWVKGKNFPTHETEVVLLGMGMTVEELFGHEIWEIVKRQFVSECGVSADEAFERKAAFFMKKLFDKIDNIDQI